MPCAAGARAAVLTEGLFQLGEQVGARTEVAEVTVSLLRFVRHPALHLLALVAMARVAFDEGCGDLLAAEDVLERSPHGSRARAGRTRDRDDRMRGGHGVSSGTGRAARTGASARRAGRDRGDSGPVGRLRRASRRSAA